jgi:hypothetical protein
MKLTAPAALLALLLASTSPGSDPRAPAWDATGRYEERKVEGWRVLVDKALSARDRQELCDETLKQLGILHFSCPVLCRASLCQRRPSMALGRQASLATTAPDQCRE